MFKKHNMNIFLLYYSFHFVLKFENFTYQRQNLKVNRIQTYKFYTNDSVTRITMQLKLHMLFFLFNISTNQPHERAPFEKPL